MNAFAILLSRDRAPVPRRLFERLLAALDHRGPDGKSVVWRPSAALGVQHFWTTCEDEGGWLPVCGRESGIDVAFEGRLDNRRELLDALALPPGAAGLADAQLALAAFRAWGRRCFERLLGPFAMAVYETARHRVVCARDPLGDRTLSYHLGPRHLAIASEAVALLCDPAVSPRLDETTLAHFFAVRPPPPGATFFAEVRELPPGHVLTFDGDRLSVEPYWRPGDLPEVRYRRDDDYVEHFKALLQESVRCRLRSPSPPAVLMSGGLDSTSVAALAAREVAAASGEKLRAISWVFDELPGADERAFIRPVLERCGLEGWPILGDEEWPLRDLDSWPVYRDGPWQGPYCRLQNRAYSVARRGGASTLLTGEYGDHLYFDEGYWLRALLAEGRWAEGRRALARELAGESPWALLRGGRARSALARALGWRGSAPAEPRWLTPYGRERLAAAGEAGERSAASSGSRQPAGVLDPLPALAASREIPNASRAGIEVRRPYRDRRLIELVLAIPAHLAYRPGWTKWILRQAMKGILPEPVRLRRQVSSLLPLAARGLIEREIAGVRRILGAPDAVWRRFVRSDWMESAFPHRLRRGLDGIETVVPWQCICMELWASRFSHGSAPAVG